MTKSILKRLGALKVGLFLLMTLATVLTVATFYESLYGTPAVQFSIYKTIWFGLLLFAISVNVLCAALKKYPWKIHQVGFLVTHVGIILICVGSFVSFKFGIDGQMLLQPQDVKNAIELPDKVIAFVSHDDQSSREYLLHAGPYEVHKNLVDDAPAPLKRFQVDQYLPYADKTESAENDPSSPSSALAIHFKNQFVDQVQWLWRQGGQDSSILMGPAKIVFKKKPSHMPSTSNKSSTWGVVDVQIGKHHNRISFSKSDIGKSFPLEGGITLLLQQFYPDARVENNQLVSHSEEFNNPALEVELQGSKGKERNVLFSKFPEFSKLHHKESFYKAQWKFEATEPSHGSSPRLEVWLTTKNTLQYWVQSSKGTKQGDIETGKSYETGWMNLHFTIEHFYPHAKKVEEYRSVQVQDPNKPQFLSAIHYRIESQAGGVVEDWMGFYESKEVHLDGKLYHVAYVSKVQELPFSLKLKEFRMGTDPGTTNPASYESHVVLQDTRIPLEEDHVISMNEPLTYQKLTFYQASYQNDENGHPMATILSVGYDPGRFLKYGGSIVMVCGILLLFFFRKTYVEIYNKYVQKKASGYAQNKMELNNSPA